jgi:hypothetical protein
MLENIIIERLKLCLPKNIYVLNIEPFSTGSTIEKNNAMASAAALQPIPAVHVLEREFQILNQTSPGLGNNKKCIQLSVTKSVWVIIVVKNAYDLRNSKEARLETEQLRAQVFAGLSYWNPETPPFYTPLIWDTEPVEIYYEASLGIMHCPLIIRPSKPYIETYELWQPPIS